MWRSNGSAAQRWTLASVATWLPSGTYEIVTAINSSNVVAAGRSVSEGTVASATARDARDGSCNWQLVWNEDGSVRLISIGSGYALTATGAKGSHVVQRAYGGDDSQKWIPVLTTGGIELRSKSSGVVLDIKGASSARGAQMQTWSSNDTNAQRFLFVKTGLYRTNTPYILRSTANRTWSLDITGGSKAEGTAVQLHAANGTFAQTFVLVDAGGGYVRFRNANSNKYLALNATTGKVTQTASVGNATKWKISFDESLNALRITSFLGGYSLVGTSARGVTTAASTSADTHEGFVMGLDNSLCVDASTGSIIKNKRVNIVNRGWCWADNVGRLHGKVTINVPYINQYAYGARMGCEGAALYMCLREAGYCKNISYRQFLNAVVYSPNGNPNLGFVGSPWYVTGNIDGVLPGGAIRWVNKYATGHDISRSGAAGLLNALCSGTPVAAWVTPRFKMTRTISVYGTTTPSSWHCVMVVGYDPATQKLQVADPASDKHVYWVSWNTFFTAWNRGQNAVTVS